MDFRLILLIAPMMLFSIIAHEYAHGYAALRQGDETALSLGRLTWNPIKHIDPILTIALPLLLAAMHAPIFGGAKPVPVDPRNYRNRRRGDIIVSLAGVTTNVIIALCCTVIVALVGLAAKVLPSFVPAFSILQAMMVFGILLNFSLVVFNLLPIPPLDGSHVVKYLLPPKWAFHYQRVGFAGLIILLLLMRVGFMEWWFKPAIAATTFLSGLVDPLILPQASTWLR